jgi:hypothetical protein
MSWLKRSSMMAMICLLNFHWRTRVLILDARQGDQIEQFSGWPDWANFRPMGGCLPWAGILKITEVAHILGFFFRV